MFRLVLVEQSTSVVLGLRHEAQFMGKSDVGNNVDQPEVLRFFGGVLLIFDVKMQYISDETQCLIGQYEKIL